MRNLLIILLSLTFAASANGQQYRLVGKLPAPAMVLTDLQGEKLDTSSLVGRTVVYNLWFVGCPPCMEEIPRLNAIVDEYQDVIFVGMSTSNATDINRFLEKQPFKYRIVPNAGKEMLIYFGNAGKDGVLNVGFPTHVVINREGYIEYRATGIKGVEGVRETLQRLAVKK
jgi:thiol-disulfide isomerase/thioredoxin